MRRKDRAVTNPQDIIRILNKNKVCHVAVNDDNVPYIVPLSYGYDYVDNQLILYFHCAKEGRKSDLWQINAHVSFVISAMEGLVTAEQACGYSCNYASVIGTGEMTELISHADKAAALAAIMHQQAGGEWQFTEAQTAHVAVWQLTVSDFTAKQYEQR